MVPDRPDRIRSAQMTTKPFKINSIAVPLVGNGYLREGNGLMPMAQFIVKL